MVVSQAKEKETASTAGGVFVWATGRRKTAVARVRLRPGSGVFRVNGAEADRYFNTEQARFEVRAPLRVVDGLSKFDIYVNVRGGGPSGQAGAVVLGVARALKKVQKEWDAPLRKEKFLTRDPREKERRKYGHKKARKSFQFSKR
jgi:small subunit ribosomal protein S9